MHPSYLEGVVGTAQERLYPPYDLSRLRSCRFGLEMAEHDGARLVVHFGLEGELVLQRDRPRRGRPCRDFIDQPFHVRIFRVGVVAEHEWRQPRPAPERHVDNGVGIADHVAAVGELIVEDLVVAMRLVLIAVMGVFQLLRRRGFEMPRLTRIGAEELEYAHNRYQYEAHRHYKILDDHLANRRYMVGDTYTIVDIAFWGWARLAPFVLGDDVHTQYPNVKRLVDEVSARPAAPRAIALKDKFTFKAEMDEEAKNFMFGHLKTRAA